jgi:S1-C subfamily serine protease
MSRTILIVALSVSTLGLVAAASYWAGLRTRPVVSQHHAPSTAEQQTEASEATVETPEMDFVEAVAGMRNDRVSTVTIASNIGACSILIDGVEAGTAPIETELEEGTHEVEVRFAHLSKTRSVEVRGPGVVEIAIDFTAEEVTEICRQAVCLVRTPLGFGSGVLVGDSYTVATAAHVIDDTPSAADLEFVFSPGAVAEHRIHGANVLYYDRENDLAVLRFDQPLPSPRVPLSLVSEAPPLGAEVLAVGNPGAWDGEPSLLAVSFGRVANFLPKVIHVDMSVNPGNSGGPVCLARSAEVVGIVNWKREDRERMAFVLPWTEVQRGLDAWQAKNEAQRRVMLADRTQRFDHHATNRRVAKTALSMYLCASMYHEVCLRVVRLAQRIGLDAANAELPRLRAEVQRRFGPIAEDSLERLYREVQRDPAVPKPTKERLQRAFEHYRQLRNEAETLTAPSVDVFERRVEDTWGRFESAVDAAVKDAEIRLTIPQD